MGYLICQECGGYYKLEKGESKDDFVSCECYGSLIYVETIDDYLKENNKFNNDLFGDTESRSSDVESANNIKSNIFVHDSDSDSDSKNGFEDETPQKKELSESLSFPSFRGSEESPSIKNRNYYREIRSEEIKPDIKKLKFIKDVNGIIEALNCDDHEIKLEAVQALGAIGDERALKHLDILKNEEKGILKTYAENAIFHIKSKNKGLKSQNRAYYREEYYKEITRKSDEDKPIDQTNKSLDQTINKIKEKQTVKTSKMPNVPFNEKGESMIKGSGTVGNGIKSDLKGVSAISLSENQGLFETKSISGTSNVPDIEGIPETGNRNTQGTAKLPGKTDNKEKTGKNKDASKLVKPSIIKTDVSKKDMSKKSTSKIDNVNRINETEGIDGDDTYFIQFLGIKNTDKPLIGFIFLFIASLGIGVLLTMGYK